MSGDKNSCDSRDAWRRFGTRPSIRKKISVPMSTKNIVVPYAQIQQAFHTDPAQLMEAVSQSARQAAGGDTALQAQMIAAWNEAVSALQKADQGGVMSTAQNGIASRLQSLIASKADEAGKTVIARPDTRVITPNGGQSMSFGVREVKFDNDDLIGWLGMAWELIFKPAKHAWIDPPTVPETIADDARIAVFADWGTGLYGAPIIKQSIVALDRCDVALHLGDTYYSGSDDEIHDRLVGDWPVRAGGKTVNRSLNGNHEMYSGGGGYFTALGDFFQQPASCFAMQNANWLLVCLDTAYIDFSLIPPGCWLTSLVNAAGNRKLILFSHHQPYSQLDAQGPNLQAALADLLNQGRIHAWFWGHEHRLVLYDARSEMGCQRPMHWKRWFSGVSR